MIDGELLQERLAVHELLLQHTEDAIVAVDRDWRITVWNRGAERMYGWTAAEVVGRHVPGFVRMDLSPQQRAAVRREALERGRWRGEVTVERRDGSPVAVEVINVAVRDARGDVTGFLGIHRDITERRRAEAALSASRHRSETILESITDAFVAVDRQWRYTYVNERALRRMQSRSGRDLTRADVLGRGMWELFPEAVGTTSEHACRDAMRERRAVRFEAYFPPSGEWIEAYAYPSDTGLSIYYHDVTDRRRAEEERETRVRQQALVAQLGLRALAADDLQEVLDEAVGLIARTLEVAYAGVAEKAPRADAITLRAGVGWAAPFRGRRIERDPLVAHTLRRGTPVIIDAVATDRRFAAGAIAGAPGIVSALSVTIGSRDEPVGVLSVLATRRRRFSQADVSFVQAVANVLASAIERSRAQQRLDEVQEAERSRIARDLHDEALQELTGALVQAHLGRAGGLDPDAADRLFATLQRVGRQLRGAIYDLRLADESRPFAEALRALVDVQRAMAVDCRIELDVAGEAEVAVAGFRATELLRIVGEALTNARRHSGARHVRVTATASERGLRLDVTDDGRGSPPAAGGPSIHGSGIRGMRERAALLGADLEIETTPGAGTTVRIALQRGERQQQPAAVRRQTAG